VTDEERKAIQDLQGFLQYALDTDMGFITMLGTLAHDAAGLLTQDPMMWPRTAGYAEYRIRERTHASEWTKRLGQKHWSITGSGRTLCGKPMLGNNYANVLAEDEKEPCKACREKLSDIRTAERRRTPETAERT